MHISLVVTQARRAVASLAIAFAAVVLLGAGPPTVSTATPTAVDLGGASDFAVLAGGGVTDTGPSIISGDVGTHPLPAIPDLLDTEASGSVDRAGAKARLAQQDLAVALASVARLPRASTVSLVEDQTLAPGVYAVTDAERGIAARLTLDGQGAANPVWIFVIAKDLVTAQGSAISLVNGAQACKVFWRVGGSASLASGSTFAGSILAMTSVTVGRDVVVDGRLLARTAAVSLGGDRIRVPACSRSTAGSAPRPTAAGALNVSSRSPVAPAVAGIALPSYLPLVMLAMLVAAAILGEPRRRHRRWPRRPRREW